MTYNNTPIEAIEAGTQARRFHITERGTDFSAPALRKDLEKDAHRDYAAYNRSAREFADEYAQVEEFNSRNHYNRETGVLIRTDKMLRTVSRSMRQLTNTMNALNIKGRREYGVDLEAQHEHAQNTDPLPTKNNSVLAMLYNRCDGEKITYVQYQYKRGRHDYEILF